MPICEADPWRLQYFEHTACPPDVNIPTEDADAWLWYPGHRWVYDKIAIALSQGLDAGPHGVPPPRFPVFSKPIVNLKGMGVASRVLSSAAQYEASLTPGHMWMALSAQTPRSSRASRIGGAMSPASRLEKAPSTIGRCMPPRIPPSSTIAAHGLPAICQAIPAS